MISSSTKSAGELTAARDAFSADGVAHDFNKIEFPTMAPSVLRVMKLLRFKVNLIYDENAK